MLVLIEIINQIFWCRFFSFLGFTNNGLKLRVSLLGRWKWGQGWSSKPEKYGVLINHTFYVYNINHMQLRLHLDESSPSPTHWTETLDTRPDQTCLNHLKLEYKNTVLDTLYIWLNIKLSSRWGGISWLFY